MQVGFLRPECRFSVPSITGRTSPFRTTSAGAELTKVCAGYIHHGVPDGAAKQETCYEPFWHMVGSTHLHVGRELGMSNPSFTFTVQHVFYIKPPIDRVMVVGVVDQGAVRPGDALVIEGNGRAMRAIVEAIVSLNMEEIPSAETGAQVALRFAGIRKDQIKAGDRVSSAGRLS